MALKYFFLLFLAPAPLILVMLITINNHLQVFFAVIVSSANHNLFKLICTQTVLQELLWHLSVLSEILQKRIKKSGLVGTVGLDMYHSNHLLFLVLYIMLVYNPRYNYTQSPYLFLLGVLPNSSVHCDLIFSL